MLKLPTLDPRHADGRGDDPSPTAAGATDVIEAVTAEAAIARVHERLGPDARILHAERLLRGGIAGFFARPLVRLHVAPGGDARVASDGDGRVASRTPPGARPSAGTSSPATAADGRGSPVDRLVDRSETADDRASPARGADGDFAHVLGGHLASDTAACSARPQGRPPQLRRDAPAVVARGTVGGRRTPGEVAAPARDDGPPWSSTALLRLGLGRPLVDTLTVGPSGGDLEWVTTIADAVSVLCRPLPVGPSVFVGPRAATLTARLRGGGEDSVVGRSSMFRDAVSTSRWTHAVVGGDGWRDALDDHVLAVSWSAARDLAAAVATAHELGLVLGFGPAGAGVRRARPLDVALGLRALLEAPAVGDGREGVQ